MGLSLASIILIIASMVMNVFCIETIYRMRSDVLVIRQAVTKLTTNDNDVDEISMKSSDSQDGK